MSRRTGRKIVVVGAQWGDEGKGKIADIEAEQADMIVRSEGGANAGHTVVVQGRTYKLHLLPCGIVRAGKMNVFGPGGVFDPKVGREELAIAREHGSEVMLDTHASVVLPIHRAIDAGREFAAGKNAIGTTLRGIGPCYSDFWLRRGLKLGDLRSSARVREVLTDGGYWDELVALCVHLGVATRVDIEKLNLGIDPMSLDATVAWCMEHATEICDHLGDTRRLVHSMVDTGRTVLFELAQGVMIGTHLEGGKFCTSSTCTPAGISASLGIYGFDRVIGVTKAYATRVGGGPFPTELTDDLGDYIRSNGAEFGTTTGRPRRCGWLDLRALRYACKMAGVTELVVTKLDVLSGLRGLGLCEEYEGVEERATLVESVLQTAKPVLEGHRPWAKDLTSVRATSELPTTAYEYLIRIAQSIGLPITSVSVGPDREAMINERIEP